MQRKSKASNALLRPSRTIRLLSTPVLPNGSTGWTLGSRGIRGRLTSLLAIVPCLAFAYARMKGYANLVRDNPDASLHLTSLISLPADDLVVRDHVFCGGCFLAKCGNRTCGQIIQRHVATQLSHTTSSEPLGPIMQQLRQSNDTAYRQLMHDAARHTYEQHPWECARCDPNRCQNAQGLGDAFHRYDTLAPPIKRATTHLLQSVPRIHRLPRDAFENLDTFVADPNNTHPARTYLFEYNPSIVVLPKGQQQNLTHPITGGMVETVYLAVYRVSNIWWCIDAPYKNQLNGREVENWMGVALLDHDLHIVAEGTFGNRRNIWEDFRVFILQNALGQPQIFVSSLRFILPMWLKEPTMDEIGPYRTIEAMTTISPDESSLQSIYIGHGPNCVTAYGGLDLDGKNFNFFTGAGDSDTSRWTVSIDNATADITTPIAMLEHIPPSDTGRHLVSIVEVLKPQCHEQARYLTLGDIESHFSQVNQAQSLRNVAGGRPEDSQQLRPSFYTIEEVIWGQNLWAEDEPPPWFDERGGACCIDMTDPRTGRQVKVGISHAKVKFYAVQFPGISTSLKESLEPGNVSYLSRFYAFDSNLPHRTVAISGHFCWPHSSPLDPGGNPYIGLGGSMHFIEHTNTTSAGHCAKIHFVSGMTIKADDPGTLIVAYGINDCVPRLIEIELAYVQQLLFYGIPSA